MYEKGKALIFFTDTFPCGAGEAFIENEFPYLAEAFEKIVIVTNNLNAPITRPVPENVTVIRYAYEASAVSKAKAATSFFNPVMQQEMQFIKKKLKITANKLIVSIMVASYAKANESVKFIDDVIQKHAAGMSVYLYSYWMNDMAVAIANYKQKHPKVKAFSRAHRWDIYLDKQPAKYLPFKHLTLEHLDMLFPISEDGAKYLRALTDHKYNNHIKVARLGTINTLGKRTSGGTDKLVLVSCSNLIPRKRVNLIIEALSLIGGKVEWIHIGDGELKAELEQLANEKLSTKANITYTFKGQMNNSDIIAYYANNNIDLFINVSESEGVPVSIMEANSFGIPAIATNTGGVAEVISESNGFLINVNSSANDIAKVIAHYARLSKEDKQAYKDSAFDTWNTLYNAQKNYTAFVDGVINL